ncbi:MAG: hypothetical protein KGH98_00825 [Candidatus Micrarchaeota archaeon]|nr:hypothetical protein [Candidatus Micrarchaeota archaeon]
MSRLSNLGTYTISRIELRRLLTAFGVSEKSISAVLGNMEKVHRHMNVISFAAMLEKGGLRRDKLSNVFRRLGMDDVTIASVINMLDEQRIVAETGRLYKATVEME